MRKKRVVKSAIPPFPFSPARFILFVIAFVCCTSVLVWFARSISHPIPHQLAETPATEMKKVPLSIARKLLTASPSATFRVPILMYHYVEYVKDKKDTLRQLLDITPDVFEAQIVTLKNAGYTFMTAKELGEVLDGKMKLPDNPVLLTFDDGHWDFDTVVLPILKKYHVKATAYVIPGFTGGSDFMSQAQVEDVVKSHLVDIGAHTVHHVSLKNVSLATVEYEVNESKKMLEDTYHIHVVSFAYPYGTFDEQAISVIKQAGFTTAVSTIPGIAQDQNNRFFLYRLRPGDRVGQTLLNYLASNSFQMY